MAAAQLVGQQPPPGGISAAAAGGEPRKKKKARMMKPRPSLEPGLGGGDAESEHAGNSKLARALGSCDFHTRERGVAALTRFLQRRTGGLPRKDMLKIWKGLFYAFWHSDKQPVQAELAERLAKVMASLHEEVAYVYFTCFIKTMRREWFGIDRLRLDKFLMLIRTFVRQMFVTLRSREWCGHMAKHHQHPPSHAHTMTSARRAPCRACGGRVAGQHAASNVSSLLRQARL
mmetsp:Transcript_3639/g.10240  ORF Transcript_3639/g.10240 Transcript_3639/m.10240 type:complete len:231 (-) Transcript_3639:70-762(-)